MNHRIFLSWLSLPFVRIDKRIEYRYYDFYEQLVSQTYQEKRSCPTTKTNVLLESV